MTTTALHIAVRARDVRPGSTRRRSEPNLRKRSAIVLCASPVCTHADQHRIKPYSAHVSPKCAHVLTISSGLATAFIRRLPNASVKLANAADANSDTDSRVIGREEEGGGARSRPRFAMHDTRAARRRCRSALCWNGAAVSQSNNSSASRRRRGRGGIVCLIAAAFDCFAVDAAGALSSKEGGGVVRARYNCTPCLCLGLGTGVASHVRREPLRQPDFGNRAQFSGFVGVL